MAQPNELAALSLTIARHELAEMRARLFDAAGGNHELVRRAAEIVKSTESGLGSITNPEHLAFELLSATYQQIAERHSAGAHRASP
jgi:hypothetical protein